MLKGRAYAGWVLKPQLALQGGGSEKDPNGNGAYKDVLEQPFVFAMWLPLQLPNTPSLLNDTNCTVQVLSTSPKEREAALKGEEIKAFHGGHAVLSFPGNTIAFLGVCREEELKGEAWSLLFFFFFFF